MQAIETKVIPATNTKPTRIKAQCARGSIIVSGDGDETSHLQAAAALIAWFCVEDKKRYGTEPEKNPWSRPRVAGQLLNGNYVHVFTA